MIPALETEIFTYEHLFDSLENESLVKDFTVKNPAGKNLAVFIKELAATHERNNSERVYLVKDKNTHELAAYFALRNGLFTVQLEDGSVWTVPAIELSNFAVNETYRKQHPDTAKIGATVFSRFILPLARHIQTLTGVQALYIYALPEDRLLDHYGSFGFSRLAKEDEQFVYARVKPSYDDGCIFMYQIL